MNTFPVTKKKMPSGLRFLLLPRSEGQTVTFMVLIGVGSRYETDKQNGLSHFLEHMFFKGTERRPTMKEIAEAIDGVGGEFNAFTGEEYTGYYVKVSAEHLEHGADVVSDILLRPLFPQEEIDRERGVIQEEIKMYTDMPMRHVQHLWQQAMFGTHPLGMRIDGTNESVSKFMRPDFVNYTKKHYHTGNTVVVVAGKFDEKKALPVLKKLFTPLPKGGETHPKAAPKTLPHTRFLHEYRAHIDQTQVMLGVPGLALSDKRRHIAALLAVILGGGFSSRLFMSVRERHGLAYTIRTSNDSYVDSGSFVTQAGVLTDKTELALKLIMEEYDRVMIEPVTEPELAKAKEMVRGHLVLELEETNAIAIFAGGQELLEKSIETPEKIWKRVNAVSARDIQKLAQELLAEEKRTLVMLSPHADVGSFETLLKKA
ncbi:MAG: insulinase family protein [Candidatus Colwellbacteria bacterium]|nr:insulinase family protein [Candidatus Colwellbacteria bacterium]